MVQDEKEKEEEEQKEEEEEEERRESWGKMNKQLRYQLYRFNILFLTALCWKELIYCLRSKIVIISFCSMTVW